MNKTIGHQLLLTTAMSLTTIIAAGCASIVDGNKQIVSIEARSGSQPISGAGCKLANNKGTWYVTTPGTTTVERSYDDMTINCDKSGRPPAVTTVKSSARGLVAGNILFGGIVGLAYDAASGAAFDYPTPITISFSDLTSETPPSTLKTPFDRMPADRRQGPSPVANENAQAEHARLAFADSGCQVSATPAKFKEHDGVGYYEAFCADGRLLHTICTGESCRLRTSRD